MQNKDNNEIEQAKIVKKLLSKNSAAALGTAVMLSLSSVLTGCSGSGDGSYMIPNGYVGKADPSASPSSGRYAGAGAHGGSYYYYRGSSYRGGSWGNDTTHFKSANAGTSSYKSGSSFGRSGGISG